MLRKPHTVVLPAAGLAVLVAGGTVAGLVARVERGPPRAAEVMGLELPLRTERLALQPVAGQDENEVVRRPPVVARHLAAECQAPPGIADVPGVWK